MVLGDLFQHRSDGQADYTKGLFYSGRVRMFLFDDKVHPNPLPPSDLIRTNSLLKPVEYRKQQKNKHVTAATVAGKNTSKSPTQALANLLQLTKSLAKNENDIPEDELDRKLAPLKSSKYDLSSSTIILDNEEGIWNLQEYGGLKVWVHDQTGEVSIENPQKNRDNSVEDIPVVGWFTPYRRDSTASTVSAKTKQTKKRYSVFNSDNDEVQEAFDILNPKLTLKFSLL